MTLKASNYPTVRPSLDLNFAQTKRLDPRITYSRASSGTYFDSTGLLKSAAANEARFDHDPTTGESLGLLVEEARTNIDQNSSSLSQWVVTELTKQPNSAVAPDGTITASRYTITTTNTTHSILRYTGSNYGDPIGLQNYSTSFFVKPNGHTKFVIVFIGGGGGSWESRAAYDLSVNTTGPVSVGRYIFGNPSGTVEVLNDGWYRIVHTFNRSSNQFGGYYYLIPYDTLPANFTSNGIPSGSYGFAGDGTSGFYLWGSQIEAGSFATSHIPTPSTFTSRSTTATYYDSNGTIQTAGINVARDDAYFPDENGVMKPAGLLLEAAGTNLVTYSEQFDNAAWTPLNLSVTPNAITAPDGTLTADKLVENSLNAAHLVDSAVFSVSSGVKYTCAVYIKAAERTAILLQNQSFAGGGWAVFDLATGTVSLTGASGIGTIQSVGNGWYRCSVTTTAIGTGGAYLRVYMVDSPTSSSGYQGDGVSGLYVWGAQLESGSSPTSYIPTTSSTVTRAADVSSSSTVTRSADVAQITGANFSSWYNQSEGSFFLDERNSYGTYLNHRFELNQNIAPNSNAITFAVAYGTWTRILSRDSSITGSIDISLVDSWTQGGSHKYAYGLEENNFSIVSGVNSATDTSGTFPPNLDSLSFGGAPRSPSLSNGGGKFSISRLTYYPVRLPDATLQTLTS